MYFLLHYCMTYVVVEGTEHVENNRVIEILSAGIYSSMFVTENNYIKSNNRKNKIVCVCRQGGVQSDQREETAETINITKLQ